MATPLPRGDIAAIMAAQFCESYQANVLFPFVGTVGGRCRGAGVGARACRGWTACSDWRAQCSWCAPFTWRRRRPATGTSSADSLQRSSCLSLSRPQRGYVCALVACVAAWRQFLMVSGGPVPAGVRPAPRVPAGQAWGQVRTETVCNIWNGRVLRGVAGVWHVADVHASDGGTDPGENFCSGGLACVTRPAVPPPPSPVITVGLSLRAAAGGRAERQHGPPSCPDRGRDGRHEPRQGLLLHAAHVGPWRRRLAPCGWSGACPA